MARSRLVTTSPALISALLLSVAYFIVLLANAVNVPVADDWYYTVAIAHASVHGTASLGFLWEPWSDGHVDVPSSGVVPGGSASCGGHRVIFG